MARHRGRPRSVQGRRNDQQDRQLWLHTTAIDGDLPGGRGSDKFRIKIWDRDKDDVVVYDNELGAGDGDDPTTLRVRGGLIEIQTP